MFTTLSNKHKADIFIVSKSSYSPSISQQCSRAKQPKYFSVIELSQYRNTNTGELQPLSVGVILAAMWCTIIYIWIVSTVRPVCRSSCQSVLFDSSSPKFCSISDIRHDPPQLMDVLKLKWERKLRLSNRPVSLCSLFQSLRSTICPLGRREQAGRRENGSD